MAEMPVKGKYLLNLTIRLILKWLEWSVDKLRSFCFGKIALIISKRLENI